MESRFVTKKVEEAQAEADAIFEYRDSTIFVRVVEDCDEWGYEALQTTMSGRLATVPAWPDSARDTREEAVERIDALAKRAFAGNAVRVK